jgi:predicted PurR-regulated permease PerM
MDDVPDNPDYTPRPPAVGRHRVVVARWVQLIALPFGILAVWSLLRAAGSVVELFVVAGIIALILNPLVTRVKVGRMPRGIAVGIVFLGLFASVALAGVLIANPVSHQVKTFRDDVPGFVDDANQNLEDLQKQLDDKGIHVQITKSGHTALETLRDQVLGGTDTLVSTGADVATTVVTAGLGLILVFVLTVYMLIYGERIGAVVRGVMPPGDGSVEDDYAWRVQRAVAGYVRGQFLFSLAMGTGAGVALWIFGVIGIFPDGRTYALAFGVFFGLMELVPFIGPFLGALPPILVALFQDPITAVWVGLLFVGLQQIEGHIVAPQIFGHTLRINPLLVIFSLLVGAEIYGVIGALMALPIAAILRETVMYLHDHTVLEPWGAPSPGLIDLQAGPD